MDDKTPPPYAGDKRRVVVIGAGIAGLTAAHELAERGFEVEVVEAALDPYGDGWKPLVGGMARTTWASVPAPADQFPLQAQELAGLTKLEADVTAPLCLPYAEIYADAANTTFSDKVLDRFTGKSVSVTVIGKLAQPKRDALEAALEAKFQGQWLTTYVSVGADPKDDNDTSCVGVEFTTQSVRVPGEHGFRFFPSFYRNMFDTMKRIPIQEASITPPSRSGVTASSDSARTAFDALKSADEIGLGLRRDRSYEISRHPIRSLQQIREILQNALERAGYRGQDLYRLVTRYLEYATSSTARRQHEYEDLAWRDFLGLGVTGNYSPYFASHVDGGAQGLAAMSSQTSDTRTIGSIAVQLSLDELRVNESGYDDATLRGPTSESLFAPWQFYLESQNVVFTCATLVGFRVQGMAVRPVFEKPAGKEPDPGQADKAPVDPECLVHPADYYVIAIPIHVLHGLFKGDKYGTSTSKISELATRKALLDANAKCLRLDELEAQAAKAQGAKVPVPLPLSERDDLRRHLEYPLHDYQLHPDAGPLRYMCGIQFYFDADVRLFLGHTLCLDSPWGVSYLSQEQYWQDRSRGQDGVRGVLSAIFTRWEVEAAEKEDGVFKTALDCTEEEIAARVWKQIADTWDSSKGEIPTPCYFFLDQNLHHDDKKGWTNDTPYLVNNVNDWQHRGGARKADGTYEYPIQLGHTVFAGTFMRTTTRLNSMEAANESGRRAVNAILAYAKVRGEAVPIYDLEEYEVPELRPLRELDARIFRKGGRHVLKSTAAEMALRAIPWDLVRMGLPTKGEER